MAQAMEAGSGGSAGSGRVGVWFIGAYGEIAVTAMVGTAIAADAGEEPEAMVSSRKPFPALGLADVSTLVFGGCEIVPGALADRAVAIGARSRTFDREIVANLAGSLREWNDNIVVDEAFAWSDRSGGTPLARIAGRLRAELDGFRRRNGLARVIVVNVSSVEAASDTALLPESVEEFVALIEADRRDLLSPSMVSAYAAFAEGCGYVNFTPNPGPDLPALAEFARRSRLAWCGSDGKTGETLVKTALAPMFRDRNLTVMSWEGINLLGNNDGRSLQNPDRAAAKLRNKKSVVTQTLGYDLHSGVDIRYVPSLGDWKTAWDLIHFKGFLGVPMMMQIIWQGCDSILAAPLVLDLVRFTEFAMRHGEPGPLTHLASFFKRPAGVDDHDYHRQFRLLVHYAERHLSAQK